MCMYASVEPKAHFHIWTCLLLVVQCPECHGSLSFIEAAKPDLTPVSRQMLSIMSPLAFWEVLVHYMRGPTV